MYYWYKRRKWKMLLGFWSNSCPKIENCHLTSQFRLLKIKRTNLEFSGGFLQKIDQTPRSILHISILSLDTYYLVNRYYFGTQKKCFRPFLLESLSQEIWPLICILGHKMIILNNAFIFTILAFMLLFILICLLSLDLHPVFVFSLQLQIEIIFWQETAAL